MHSLVSLLWPFCLHTGHYVLFVLLQVLLLLFWPFFGQSCLRWHGWLHLKHFCSALLLLAASATSVFLWSAHATCPRPCISYILIASAISISSLHVLRISHFMVELLIADWYSTANALIAAPVISLCWHVSLACRNLALICCTSSWCLMGFAPFANLMLYSSAFKLVLLDSL